MDPLTVLTWLMVAFAVFIVVVIGGALLWIVVSEAIGISREIDRDQAEIRRSVKENGVWLK